MPDVPRLFTVPFLDADGERQIARHQELLKLWQGCTVEELVNDLNVLVQLTAFRVHQARLLTAAQEATAQGATHDCGEWVGQDGVCGLCGMRVPPRRGEGGDV